MVALDANDGSDRWNFDSDGGGPPTGCGGVWSSPAVDTTLGLVFAGTANCPSSPTGWNTYSEAIFAVDLDTGAPKWSFQPRGPSNNDFDFAGAPNLFEADGRAVVGLGGKDGVYYAVDRATGKLVWKRRSQEPRVAVEELLDRRVHRRDRGRRRRDRRRHRDRRSVPVPARHQPRAPARSRGSRASPRRRSRRARS